MYVLTFIHLFVSTVNLSSPSTCQKQLNLAASTHNSWLVYIFHLVIGQTVLKVLDIMVLQPKVDEDHPKWLHLRIRSPHSPTTDIAKVGGGGVRPRSRRLVDGRWTLAFPDEKTCKYAQEAVLEEIDIQRLAVQQVLEPLLDVPAVSMNSEDSTGGP